MRNTLLLLATGVLLAGSAAAQNQKEEYLDILVAKVKPEKRAEFDALNKRLADANRRNNGDGWMALTTEYGENNTVTLVSWRANYGAIDKGLAAFMGALNKAYGEAGAKKMFQEFNSTIVSSTGEIRRRRFDLSMNLPDPAAWAQMMGEARWLRTTTIKVRLGRAAEYEAQIAHIKQIVEAAGGKMPVFISQNAAGTRGNVYYVSMFGKSLGAFDEVPSVKQILGDEGYQAYMKVVSEVVVDVETTLNRILPELSNMPKEVVAVAPGFWTPRPAPAAAAAKPAPKPAETH